MSSARTIRFIRTAALLAPFVVSGVAGQTALCAGAQADAPAEAPSIRVAPGRVAFSVSAAGSWTFGARGGKLLAAGTSIVYTTDDGGNLVERLHAASPGAKSLLPPGGIALVQEGVPGGARQPSSRADDDNDRRIDEDPLDRIDNDGDGRIDEDFAAIGDAMAVVRYGTATGNAIAVRQEVYAWTLPHIDRMAATAFFVRNTGSVPLPGVRIGFKIVPGEAIADNRLLARSTHRASPELAIANVMLRGRDESLGALFFSPHGPEDDEWQVRDDGENVRVVSPALADLAPGEEITVYVALVAAPVDETQATRAMHSARRTVLGDGVTRMVPPPVSLSAQGRDELAPPRPQASWEGGLPAVDAFWLTPGKLDDVLLTGSPNPFRDAITVEYEVPTHALDEDGIEHVLSGAAVATSVKVYNVTGRLVVTLVESPHGPGRYRTGWTAQTDEGDEVASGVYYVKLAIGKRSVTKRLVQIK